MAGDDDVKIEAASSNAAELVSLKSQRTITKRNISNIKKKLETDFSIVDLTVLECRLQILESYFKQICHIQGQIEKIGPSSDSDTARSDFEELYIEIKAKMMSRLRSRGSVQLDQTIFNATSTSSSSPKLPALKLPHFNGKYGEYTRFITTFTNMVHDNASLTSVDKFNYLLTCLSGAALAVVEPFQITDENYSKALERLKERYDNKVLIFLEHITALFNVSHMSKGDGGSLRSLIDTVAAIRGSLLSIGDEKNVVDAILIHLVHSKLDADTQRSYDERQEFNNMPSWDTCYTTLSNRCQFLECHGTKSTFVDTSRGKSRPNLNKSAAHTFVNSKPTCAFCNSDRHHIGSCSEFLKLIVSERFNFVKRSGLCINCLRQGHMSSKCPSTSRCRVCNCPHHTTLHIFSAPAAHHVEQQQHSSSSGTVIPQSAVSLVARCFKRAIIPTAVVLIADNCGSFVPARVLLDSCSEINFITEELAKRLKLKLYPANQRINGIGEVQTSVKYSVQATIMSRITEFTWSSIFAVTKTIAAHQPGEYIETANWKIPDSVNLADPLFYKPQRIDMLISTEIFLDLLIEGRFSLGPGMPTLKNTVFGWIVGGKFTSPTRPALFTCNLACEESSETNLDKLVQNFWKIEEFTGPVQINSDEEQQCEKHFVENVKILEDGRIQVKLPFKLSPEALGESFDTSKKRFLALERRLNRDSTLKSMYVDFINEYMALGHMSPYTKALQRPYYIIPHHCVLRPESTTTKLRVVFDASAQTSSSRSLNEILMVGPTIQQDLITTMFSFRLHKFALTADISKMYRQFNIDEPDRKYQLILWRSNPDHPIKIYQLNTVTYGLSWQLDACSSLLTSMHCHIQMALKFYKRTYMWMMF